MNGLSSSFQADCRQFGGMMMITGFCAIIMPIAGIVSAFGPDGATYTDPSTIPFWGMIGGFCLFINGTVAVLTGYLACVHDWSHSRLTLFMIVIIQSAFIPYITDMTMLGKLLRKDPSDQPFIPVAYGPTETDVKFVGSMGLIAIFSYGFAFVGSFSFLAFCLHAYNTGNYAERTAEYYQGRMGFYCGMLFIGGLAQLALGAYTAHRFGVGALEEGPVAAAFLVVNYPIVCILVGGVQVLHGIWGLARSVGVHSGPDDNAYVFSMALQWIAVLCLQDVMQIAYFPGDMMAGMAAGVAAMSFGINVMPAFLDHKMRTTPDEFPESYYIQVAQRESALSEPMNDRSTRSARNPSISQIKEVSTA